MENKPFSDIANAVYQLRRAFLKHGMEPPISIELGNVKDGISFRRLMTSEFVMSQPRMGLDTDDPEWVANLAGVEVRMPAEWRGLKAGRRELSDPTPYSQGDGLGHSPASR